MNMLKSLLSWCLLLVLTACATQPLVRAPQLEGFAQAVSDVRKQSTTTFDIYNKTMRAAQIDYAATQRKLVPSLFFEVFDQESAANWAMVLGILDDYAGAMQQISDPALISAYRDRSAGLLANINQHAQMISQGKLWQSDNARSAGAGLATLAIKLGEAVMRAKANKAMAQALPTTDPAVQDLVAGLRAVINSDQGTGLRSSLEADSKNGLATAALAFDAARTPGDKRRAAEAYAELLDVRDARLASLAAFDRSLKSLGDAHSAMARGQPASAEQALLNIRDELRDTQKLYGDIRQMMSGRAAPAKGGAGNGN
jgi:hypothetical protein